MKHFLFLCISVIFLNPIIGQIEDESQPPPPPLPTPLPKEKEIFKVVEDMPRFPGCEDIDGGKDAIRGCAEIKLIDYIYSNLEYPLSAKENGIEGKCYIQFIVSENGDVENVKIVRDIGYGCGEAAKAVVEAMNELPQKWISGKQRGRPVEVLFTLPIEFNLEGVDRIREYDEEQKKSKVIIINSEANNDQNDKFHVYNNGSKIFKLGSNEYKSVKLKNYKNNLFVYSNNHKTDSYNFELHINAGQTAYLSIVKDGDMERDKQYYKLIEISAKEAKVEMANMNN